MRRRTFVQWLVGAAVALPMPRWLWSRVSALAELSAGETAALREVAAVVLPQSFGRARTDEIAGGFARWIRGYREGAELPSGYGFTRLERAGLNPALGYAKQLQQLDAGKPFAQLDAAAKRAAIEQSLAKIDEVPSRPNGKNVAADLMSYFFHSSEGHDYLYDAAIRIEDCRGLPSSPKKPAREEA